MQGLKINHLPTLAQELLVGYILYFTIAGENTEKEKHRSQNRKSNTMGLENSTEASRM